MDKHSAGKEFARYASLNMLGMLGISCYILADTFFISRATGAQGLAALNLALPVYSLIHGLGLMLGMGGGIRYSIGRGQGDRQSGDGAFTQALCLFPSPASCLPGPWPRLWAPRGKCWK